MNQGKVQFLKRYGILILMLKLGLMVQCLLMIVVSQ